MIAHKKAALERRFFSKIHRAAKYRPSIAALRRDKFRRRRRFRLGILRWTAQQRRGLRGISDRAHSPASDISVFFTLNRGFSQNACCLLERGRRDKGACLERGFCNPEENRNRRRRRGVLIPLKQGRIDLVKLNLVHLLITQKCRVANVGDFNFLQHLADDNFNMFVVNRNMIKSPFLTLSPSATSICLPFAIRKEDGSLSSSSGVIWILRLFL